MKKSTLLFLFVVGSCTSMMAQPVLTASGIEPVIGNTFTTNSCNYVSPGNSGANQTWNLAFTSSGAASSTAVAPSSSPYASSFPNATVAFGGSTWTFEKGTATAWQNCGLVNGSGTILAYSDLEDFLRFPFTYTNSYTDTWSVDYMQAGYPYYRWGTTTVTADAYGTLTTPDGTFANVTRVHFVQSYRDSANILSNAFVQDYVNDEYMWYLNGNHNVIAAVYNFTIMPSSTTSGGFYMTGVVSDVNENSSLVSLSLSPNPASDNANFTVNLDQEKEMSISLFNSIGQEMEEPVTTAGIVGENKISIPVAELPSGVYFAMISLDGTKVLSRKFIVTH